MPPRVFRPPPPPRVFDVCAVPETDGIGPIQNAILSNLVIANDSMFFILTSDIVHNESDVQAYYLSVLRYYVNLAVTSSARPWIAIFVLPEKKSRFSTWL